MHASRPPKRGSALLSAAVAAAMLLVGSLVFPGVELAAQRVVPVHQEPRHRLVLEDAELKLLDVQILPGDTTLYHTHSSPILYTHIGTRTGPADGNVTSNTAYLDEPLTHQVTNQGDHLFRIVALVHYGPGDHSGAATRPEGIRAEPQVENPWFRSYRIELAPGEETPLHRHRHPAVVIQVSEGRVEVSRENGLGAELARIAEWTWREAESPYRIRNVGATPVAVVVNEGRRPR
jgi:quercetin dioxygenase-like cupin family protein